MVGEDFSWYLQKIPGTFFFFMNQAETGGVLYPHHSACFAIDENVLDRGAAAFANYVLTELG